MNIKKIVFYACNVFFPLVFGMIIYLCSRPDTFVSSAVLDVIGVRTDLFVFPKLVTNYIPDMVWAYSLTFMLRIVIGRGKKGLMMTCFIAILFSSFMEMIQIVTPKMFTFDLIDILVEAFAVILAFLWISFFEKEERI